MNLGKLLIFNWVALIHFFIQSLNKYLMVTYSVPKSGYRKSGTLQNNCDILVFKEYEV